MLEKLREHIEYCLRVCEKDHQQLWEHQAFGALIFFTMVASKEEQAQAEEMWTEEYRPQFEYHIWKWNLFLETP